MDPKERVVKRKLVQIRRVIREKYNALKQGQLTTEKLFESAYKPILSPLRNIEGATTLTATAAAAGKHNFKTAASTIKKDSGSVLEKLHQPIVKVYQKPMTSTKETSIYQAPSSTPQRSNRTHTYFSTPQFLPSQVIAEEDVSDDSDNNPDVLTNAATPHRSLMLEEPGAKTFLEQYHPLPREYVERMISDTQHETDTTYGVTYNEKTDKWYIGDSPIEVVGKDLIIKEKKYVGTPGLYELLIMSKPNWSEITRPDRANYRDIILSTHLHKRGNTSQGQIKGTRAYKYTNVIKPILDATSGQGLHKEVVPVVEHRYWDNIHELIQELQVRWAEKEAGHTGHRNDIISIAEELYEAGYIENPLQSKQFLSLMRI